MRKEKKQFKELSEEELKNVTGGTFSSLDVTGVLETDAVRARYSVLFSGNPKETETDGIKTIYD